MGEDIDVAQILGIKASANGSAPGDLDQLKPSGASPIVRGKLTGVASKQKKLTGMQREVLELLESNHRASHALYHGFGKTSLKQKWQERKKSPAVKWLRKPFRNPARASLAGESGEAGLVLTHWVKAHVELSDYVFARFNVKSETTSYTDEDYHTVLAPHVDPLLKWTKEETDVLFKLCQRFDLRWVVVVDRYNSNPIAKGAFRSMEDIKYRYYEVTRLLAEHRDKKARGEIENKVAFATSAAAGTTQTTASTGGLNASGTATPTASVVIKTEPKAFPSAPSTPASVVSVPGSSEHFRFNVSYEKQRKRQLDLMFSRTDEEENEIRRLNEELRSVEQQLKKVAVRVDPKKKKELADVPYEIKRTLPTGVILRSSLLALPQQKHALSAKLLKKLQLLLDEMGVPARPMPTKSVCETYDKVRQDAVGLLSLRKYLKSKQSEVQTLRERYQALTGKDYTPTTTPVTISERPGDVALASGSNSAASSATHSEKTINKGKASKHSEKAIRAAKRRHSSALPGLPAKRNKKKKYSIINIYAMAALSSQVETLLAAWNDATAPLDARVRENPLIFASEYEINASLYIKPLKGSGADHIQDLCRPWNHESFLARVSSFSIASWFAKPDVISVFECARHGWKNSAPDQLYCNCCARFLCFKIDGKLSEDGALEVAQKFANQLVTGHKELCPWRDNPSPESFTTLPIATKRQVFETFLSRLDEDIMRMHSDTMLEKRMENVKIADALLDKILREADCVIDVEGQSKNETLKSKLSARILKHGNRSVATEALCNSALIILCGWKFDDQDGSQFGTLWCGFCNRRWQIFPQTTIEKVHEDNEPKVKRLKVSKDWSLDPLSEHRYFCPWVVGGRAIKTDDYGEIDPNLLEFVKLPGWNQYAQALVLLDRVDKAAVATNYSHESAKREYDPAQALTTVRAVLGL
ncbi:hypothetical protein PsorP6_011202 [Peronosclerospora sorghi]|uniref:Uncharacterized protein n=1 Tax=Peronosclerospora sorghi TaxID=230839 RepID=A0ACC0VVS5_9STRA|nr:hypothetical protein PsorP6_011202 [Peronosclerospora sorghi]